MMPVTKEVVRLMGESMEQLIVRSTRVVTRRDKVKLFLRSLWYPWPLRQFQCEDREIQGLMAQVTKVGGWIHDDGTVYVTYIHHSKEAAR